MFFNWYARWHSVCVLGLAERAPSLPGQTEGGDIMPTQFKAKSSLTQQALGVLSAVILFVAPTPTYAQAALVPDDQITAELAVLPENRLKEFYLHCSHEASRHVLGLGEAALCSMIYETLLGRIFGGDFHALLAWSRVQPDATIAAEPAHAIPARTAEERVR
jgi:hypothetical protein